MIRSLSKAICTSGEPVSFVCWRYFSINPDLTSLKPLSPLRPFLALFRLLFDLRRLSQLASASKKYSTIPGSVLPARYHPLMHQKSSPGKHQSDQGQHHSQRPERSFLRQQRDGTDYQRRFHQNLRQIEARSEEHTSEL